MQPRILVLLRGFLTKPRSPYSTDFAKYAVDDDEDYERGMVMLASLFFMVVAIWIVVLLILKCQGETVGCASGNPVRSEVVSSGTKNDDGSTDVEDHAEEDRTEEVNTRRGEHAVMSLSSSMFSQSINNGDPGDIFSAPGEGSTIGIGSVVYQIPVRQRRMQMAFGLLSLATIVCVPMILIFSFAPLKEAATDSEAFLVEARDIVNEVDASLVAIESATQNVVRIVEGVTFDINDICPAAADPTFANGEVAEELQGMLTLFESGYQDVESRLSDAISDTVIEVSRKVSDALDVAENAYHKMDDYVWMVPGLLLVLSSLLVILSVGVFLAWKAQSNDRFQDILSYGILPFFFALSIGSWAMAAAAGLTTAASSDVCLSVGSQGSPDDTVALALQYGGQVNGTVGQFVSAYTSGCTGDKPTAELHTLEEELQEIVDFIWQHLSNIDSQGREGLLEACGDGSMSVFLAASRDMAKLLTAVRKSVGSIQSSLECDRVGNIYVEAVHESLCTDIAAASAWGFILFAAVGILTMCIVSVRASWRHKVCDEKIYDEDDVAENMIVDEHEEYLEYISRFKHEWQDYGGIEDPAVQEQRRTAFLQSSALSPRSMLLSDPSTGSESLSDDGAALSPHDDSTVDVSTFDPYPSMDNRSPSSAISADISFASLRDPDEIESRRPMASVLDREDGPTISEDEPDTVAIPEVSGDRGDVEVFLGRKNGENRKHLL